MTAPQTTHLVEPMMPRPYRVGEKWSETADTVTLELVPDDATVMPFHPGQFTMLYVLGVGEVPISIAGDPHRPEVVVHTIRTVGAVTQALVGMEPGEPLGVRGPYGAGWPTGRAEGKDLVVVAGGIGLAPLRPVVLDVIARRERYGAVTLIYGARSPSDLLYVDQLRTWRSRFDIQVEVTVDRPDRDWQGDVGVVTGLFPRIELDPAGTVAMLCGPEVMMKVVARELFARGMSTEQVYLSMERNMKCAIGFCGHCQLGPDFVCRDGPVLSYHRLADRLTVPEL
jgi:NAD(P)H-flavin reductase